MALAMSWMSSWMMTVLPTPAPPTGPTLPPLDEGAEQVDDLDPGLEQLGLGRQLVELGRLAVDGPTLGHLHRAQVVDGLTHQVEDAAEVLLADGHLDRRARVLDLLTAGDAVGGVEGYGTDAPAAQVLGDLAPEDLALRLAEDLPVHVDLQGVVDRGQVVVSELRVHDRADDLRNVADIGIRHGLSFCYLRAGSGDG